MTTTEEMRTAVVAELITADDSFNPDNKEHNIRIIEDIKQAVTNLADGNWPSAKHIAEVAVATNKNIQVRDYLMGLRQEVDYRFVGQYLEYITELVKKDYALPLATVLSSYFYQAGDVEQTKELLLQVLDVDPDYSLAKLLTRVVNAGWEPESMAEMAKELHQKIVDGIYEIETTDDDNN